MTTQRPAPGPATLALLAACLGAYLFQIASGADWWDAAPADLLRIGANYAPAIAAGETWRLLSGIFLHGGLVHLLLNMLALADIGSAVERRLGVPRTLAVFVLSGALGALASAARHSGAISVGASGAIFGLFAVWLLVVGGKAGEAPALVRRQRTGLAIYAVIALGSGFLIPGLDNAAHLGGFAGGLLFGLLGRERRSPHSAGRAFWLIALLVATLGWLAARAFPEAWAVPYVEGRRFDQVYRDFAVADRRIAASLQRIGRESRTGRLSDSAALARIDAEILPALRETSVRWQQERFADPAVEKERAVWVEYAQLRLDAIVALRTALVTGDPSQVRRFEAKMAAAAGLVTKVQQRRRDSPQAAPMPEASERPPTK